MHCDELDLLIEAVADGSQQLSADQAAHLAACAVCTARLESARAIESSLAVRAVAAPSPGFTAGVMARVSAARWRTERFVDLGFNLAMIAGAMVIAWGAAGLAWSLGFVNLSVDLDAVWRSLGSEVGGKVLSQVQTLVVAMALLTVALGLWWWAEGDTAA